MNVEHEDSSLACVAKTLNIYVREVEAQRALCEKHWRTVAIHNKGNELQIYRQFERKEEIAASIRRFGDLLPGWEETLEWKSQSAYLSRIQKAVERRMEKHSKQHAVYTRGVAWEHRPILIHAYKFEPDPRMKLEIVLPNVQRHFDELPVHRVCSALRCHEYLIPDYIAASRPPYEGHDMEFLTLTEYLSKTMPKGLYATEAISFIQPQ